MNAISFRIIDDMSVSGTELDAQMALLPEWRRAQALKFRYESGRRECTLSYLLLSDMLGFQPEFRIGEHGKPEVLQASQPVSFNLSHCKRAIACVVSDGRQVGIDVECLGRYKPSLAEYCMSDEENQQILAADDPDLEFTLLWTRKEALLKCTGEGITDDMKSCLMSRRAEGITIESRYNKVKGYAWSVAYTNVK